VTRLHQFITHPFLASEEIALTFQARILYWHIMGLYYYTLGDTAREGEVQETLIQHMSSRPDYIQDFPLEYILVYGRWLTLSLAAPEAMFAEYMEVFMAFPQNLRRPRRDVEAQVETEAALIQVERLMRMGMIPEAQAALGSLQEVLRRHDRHLSLRQRCIGHLLPALIQAAAGQPRLALPGLNTILNTYPEAQCPDLYAAARLLNLMVHADLGNASVVNYEATSWHRYLLQHQPYCQAELWLMDFFMRLTRDGRKHPLPLSAWVGIRDTLRQLQDDPLQALPVSAPDILAWLNTKIDQISAEST
jgi:hypothetical protein